MGVSFSAHKPTLIAFVHAHPYLTEITARMVTVKNTLLPASPLAVLFVANEGHYRLERQAREFFQGVTTGENLTKGDARLALRSWFYQQQARARRYRHGAGVRRRRPRLERLRPRPRVDRHQADLQPEPPQPPDFRLAAEGFTDVKTSRPGPPRPPWPILAKSPRRQPSARPSALPGCKNHRIFTLDANS